MRGFWTRKTYSEAKISSSVTFFPRKLTSVIHDSGNICCNLSNLWTSPFASKQRLCSSIVWSRSWLHRHTPFGEIFTFSYQNTFPCSDHWRPVLWVDGPVEDLVRQATITLWKANPLLTAKIASFDLYHRGRWARAVRTNDFPPSSPNGTFECGRCDLWTPTIRTKDRSDSLFGFASLTGPFWCFLVGSFQLSFDRFTEHHRSIGRWVKIDPLHGVSVNHPPHVEQRSTIIPGWISQCVESHRQGLRVRCYCSTHRWYRRHCSFDIHSAVLRSKQHLLAVDNEHLNADKHARPCSLKRWMLLWWICRFW